MENLGKRIETTDISITNRIQEMDKRNSGLEDMIEEIKEMQNLKKSMTQTIQQIWVNMKRINLSIIGIEEEEEKEEEEEEDYSQLRDPENIFNTIIEESFLNLKKDMFIYVQKVYRIQN
jgi:arginine deiminase